MSEAESIPFDIEGYIGEIKAAEQLCPGVYYVAALDPEIGLPQEYYAVNKYHAQGAPRRMKTVVRRATIKAHGTRLLSLCRFERDKQISLCSPVEPQIVPASLRGRGRIAK